MNPPSPPPDFESSWQEKLAQALESHLDPDELHRILAGGEELTDSSTPREKTAWSADMLSRLQESLPQNECQDVLTGCACQYPKNALQDARGLYLETGDVDQVLDLLQAKFEAFLRDDLELEEDLVNKVVQLDWGLAGVRVEDRILATKIPKSAYIEEYFQTEDPLDRRRLYCHCPRVRDALGGVQTLPELYCYCGAGFYRGIWETVLARPVRVLVLESVLQGDENCRIAVLLPPDVVPEEEG